MTYPTLVPASVVPHVILPKTGSLSNINSSVNPLPYGVYADESEFLDGAVRQVNHVYRMLAGDVLNLEITEYDVYAAYEDAVLEYSAIINMHQAKNVLSSALGNKVGSFDENGNLIGNEGEVQPGSHPELSFPRFDYANAKRIGDAASHEASVGGNETLYLGKFELVSAQQEYDLQELMQTISDTDTESNFYGKIGEIESKNKIEIKKVYYKSPRTMWRFFGYFGGGMSVLGNLSTYGMWADDSQFQVVPVWQNRLQAKAFEETMYVRASHYSYRIINNKLKVYPVPSAISPAYMYIEFYVPTDLWSESGDDSSGVNGVNNINTLPFENIPYTKINSIGKQWIRKYALATCKEILGGVRNKVSSIPIPNGDVTLNGSELVQAGREDKERYISELKKELEEATYDVLMQKDKEMVENAELTLSSIPMPIYVG